MGTSNRFNFTQASLDNLTPPTTGRHYYRDEQESALGLSHTANGTKSFFVVVRQGDGTKRRVILGRYPTLKIAAARKAAKATAGKAAEGKDVVEEKRERRRRTKTLNEVLNDYIEAKGEKLKASTVADYRRAINEVFADLTEKQMSRITSDQILTLYKRHGKRSPARAENARRVLRAIFNFARKRHQRADGTSPFDRNPVDAILDLKLAHEVRRRDTVLHAHQLPAWWSAVESLKNPVARDYLQFLILTGCRKGEAARLRWRDVDLDGRLFRLHDTKNRETVTLPLPGHVARRLDARRPDKPDEWIFPGSSTEGNYDSPYEAVKAVSEASGVIFTPHDLRRTFITIAEGLDIGIYSIKRLVNHKLPKSDVTTGYIVRSFDRLALASRKVERQVLSLAGVLDGQVVQLRAADNA